MHAIVMSLVVVVVLAGCDASDDDMDGAGDGGAAMGAQEPSVDGRALYENPVEDGNSYACATCHALSEPTEDGMRRPGHPIGDAALRPDFKNGRVAELSDAINSCLTEWMNAEPWSDDDPRQQALRDFLGGQDGGEAPALSFEIGAATIDLGGGDADAGQALFNTTCVVCHGLDGGGSRRAPPVAGLGLTPDYIARRVRTSGVTDSAVYDGLTGGKMPFWSLERLSDDELRDLVAWLPGSDEAPFEEDPEPPAAPDAGAGLGDGGDCGSDHPLVGATAELSTRFHGVMGSATVVDDCTLEITDFVYDGGGIDVRIYGGLGGDYDSGFPMTEDLLDPGGYDGATITAKVPAGKTLDDLDGISVWCVDVGVDFGSAMFAP